MKAVALLVVKSSPVSLRPGVACVALIPLSSPTRRGPSSVIARVVVAAEHVRARPVSVLLLLFFQAGVPL